MTDEPEGRESVVKSLAEFTRVSRAFEEAGFDIGFHDGYGAFAGEILAALEKSGMTVVAASDVDRLLCGQCGDTLLPSEIEGHLNAEGRTTGLDPGIADAYFAPRSDNAGEATGTAPRTQLPGPLVPIDIDDIEMRWASQWGESDDGQKRAWRTDVARLIDEVRALSRPSPGRWAVFEDEDGVFRIVTDPDGADVTWPEMNEADCAAVVQGHNLLVKALRAFVLAYANVDRKDGDGIEVALFAAWLEAASALGMTT